MTDIERRSWQRQVDDWLYPSAMCGPTTQGDRQAMQILRSIRSHFGLHEGEEDKGAVHLSSANALLLTCINHDSELGYVQKGRVLDTKHKTLRICPSERYAAILAPFGIFTERISLSCKCFEKVGSFSCCATKMIKPSLKRSGSTTDLSTPSAKLPRTGNNKNNTTSAFKSRAASSLSSLSFEQQRRRLEASLTASEIALAEAHSRLRLAELKCDEKESRIARLERDRENLAEREAERKADAQDLAEESWAAEKVCVSFPLYLSVHGCSWKSAVESVRTESVHLGAKPI